MDWVVNGDKVIVDHHFGMLLSLLAGWLNTDTNELAIVDISTVMARIEASKVRSSSVTRDV